MPNIRGTSQEINSLINEKKEVNKKQDADIENVEFLFSTSKLEDERGDFESTFEEFSVVQKAVGGKVNPDKVQEQAIDFYNGLVENKDKLCEKLGISEDKYDDLAFVALALASQETGMGAEDGYQEENKGIGKLFRGIGKAIDVFRGGLSASSGLTQMKIHEFLENSEEDGGLPADKKQILKDYGIKSGKIINNNLFKNPDKAAVSTIVVLSELSEKYDDYKSSLNDNHTKIGDEISENPTELKKAEKEGNNILNTISKNFGKLSLEEQNDLRTTFKQVLLSTNGSKEGSKDVDDDYNEELNLNKLNELLSKNDIDLKLDETSLNKIRYALTADGAEMNKTEYLAYAWNKGTGETGMQLDRMLAAKIGTMFTANDSFDADQFESNVSALADKYKDQTLA